jgi:Zn-dependent protease with chaperone function
MDFFDRQAQAKRQTGRLLLLFALAVIITITACYFLLLTATGASSTSLWQPTLFYSVTLVVLSVVGGGSVYKFSELSSGGSAVATMLGGRPIHPQTSHIAERRLLNIVEEMALAAGTRVPTVFLLENESGINAFAAGHSTDDAVIGVTAGALNTFKREELQGVIGHEFSHILNGDMRLNMRLMGWIFGISCLAQIGYWILRFSPQSGRSSKDKNPLPFIGFGLLVIGGIGAFFGNLIQAAISRQREFLADASAVQFTRNPGGIGGALRRLLKHHRGGTLDSGHASEASHFFFAQALSAGLTSLFATHPPLEERISAIENIPLSDLGSGTPSPRLSSVPGLSSALGLSQLDAPVSQPSPPLQSAPHQTPENDLYHAAHDPASACAVCFALLLSRDPDLRQAEIAQIKKNTAEVISQELQKWLPSIDALDPAYKLPLIDLCLPALRLLSQGQFQRFMDCLDLIMDSDNQINLFEFTLQKIMRRHLQSYRQTTPSKSPKINSLLPVQNEAALLLSALAHLGTDDSTVAEQAFAAGATLLATDTTSLPFVDLTECGIAQIDRSLNQLVKLNSTLRQKIAQACETVVLTDGIVFPAEAELIRAVADSLDCITPRAKPFLSQ